MPIPLLATILHGCQPPTKIQVKRFWTISPNCGKVAPLSVISMK
jgi:hypothetical protein